MASVVVGLQETSHILITWPVPKSTTLEELCWKHPISVGRDEAELSRREQVTGWTQATPEVGFPGQSAFHLTLRMTEEVVAPVSTKGLGPPCSSQILNPGLLHHSHANFL